jgi:hypothetical protein
MDLTVDLTSENLIKKKQFKKILTIDIATKLLVAISTIEIFFFGCFIYKIFCD